MENRRRQNWDYRRSKNKRPPRSSSQPTVPKWEKQFCKVIGSLDWETLLYSKKSIYLFEDVMNWDDSAGEEAFSNAKKRYWAHINGLSCDISLPSPNLYIDEINWDELRSDDLETEPVICDSVDQNHGDPVIIFGDSLLPNYQGYATTGWGDTEENLHQVAANTSSADHVEPWGNSVNNWGENGWPVYSNNYMTWEGGWNDNDWGWNYSNNNFEEHMGVEANRYMSSYGTSMVRGHDHYRHDISKNYKGRHEMTYLEEQSNTEKRPNSFDSCARINHYGSMTVGQTWNR